MDWEALLNDYYELKEAYGYSSKEAAKTISNLYFGSE